MTNINRSGVHQNIVLGLIFFDDYEPTADWSRGARYESNVSCSNIKDLSQPENRKQEYEDHLTPSYTQTGTVLPLIAGAAPSNRLHKYLLFIFIF